MAKSSKRVRSAEPGAAGQGHPRATPAPKSNPPRPQGQPPLRPNRYLLLLAILLFACWFVFLCSVALFR